MARLVQGIHLTAKAVTERGMVMIFNFYFFEVPNAFNRPSKLRRGISALDGPNGRYNSYFHSLAMEIHKEDIDEVTAAIDSITAGACNLCELGGMAWIIRLNSSSVEFESLDYDEMNDGLNNTFPLNEFIWAFLAWREFLLKSDEPSGTKYEFSMPVPVSNPFGISAEINLLKKIE